MPIRIVPFQPEVLVDGVWQTAVCFGVVKEEGNKSIWTSDHSLEYRLKDGRKGLAQPGQWRIRNTNRRPRQHARLLLMCFIFVLAGCGASNKSSSSSPPPPPPPPASQMTGSWIGNMVFSSFNANLELILSQDSAGHLTGSAISNPPLCQFNEQVSGSFANNQWGVNSADGAVGFAGTLSSDGKSLSGNVQLGSSAMTGCGPRLGTLSVQKQ